MPSDIETVDKLGVMHLGGCVNDDDVGIATALDWIVLHNKLQNQIEASITECLEAIIGSKPAWVRSMRSSNAD